VIVNRLGFGGGGIGTFSLPRPRFATEPWFHGIAGEVVREVRKVG
jgi:hypothetical protein